MNIKELIKKLEICPICGGETIHNEVARMLFCRNNPSRVELYLGYHNGNRYELDLNFETGVFLRFTEHNEKSLENIKIKDLFNGNLKKKIKTIMLLR
jgi:hypothetical protein